MEFRDLPLDLKKFVMYSRQASGNTVVSVAEDALHMAADAEDFMLRALQGVKALHIEVSGAMEYLQGFGFER